MSYRLSPSDLTFLWDECPRCFYLKVRCNFKRPATPFPAIFTAIDGLMKAFFQDQPTHQMNASLPPGKVLFSGSSVRSQPIQVPGHIETCYIDGKFDTVLAFDDNSYGVVDFKTSEPKPDHVAFYGRQLHAYAYALEHPAAGRLNLAPISHLGLFTVQPQVMARQTDGRIAYVGDVTWLEVPYDEGAFLTWLDEVMTILESPEPPAAGSKCVWCQYRQLARENPEY